MSILAGLVRWCDRWLNNGANLITLSRIPVLLFILGPIYAYRYELPSWFPVLLGAPFMGVFWQGGIAQIVGMIADGLDGFYARRLSRGGSTSEGQFLDQFIDKIFIWVVWWALSFLLYTDSSWMILYWWIPSLYLFFLDCRSCFKHWRNYKKDKGKKVNKKHGAVGYGKWKFGFENVVVCSNLAVLITPSSGLEFLYWPTKMFYEAAYYLQPLSYAIIIVAICLARASLRKRGVLPLKKGGTQEQCPDYFAEAST